MAKSLREIVDEGNIIISEEMFGTFKNSVDTSHTSGGVVSSTPLVATDPAVAAAPQTYTRLDDTGKQQLCVRFSSGAIQILATEPD